MLRLRAPSDPRWLQAALADMGSVLVDHAHCEMKAAVTALSFVSRYPDDPELVQALSTLASEEASHLAQVAALCHARGLTLGHPGPDAYAQGLLAKASKSGLERRRDRLLVCAIIEARSCERLQLLAENLPDGELQALYAELWPVEAGHFRLFTDLAVRSVERGRPVDEAAARQEVDARLDVLLADEAALLATLPVQATIH